MTPDKARRLLDGAAPGEWQWDDTGNVAAVDGDGWEHVADYVYEEDAALIVAAPVMARMIAGMRPEYRAEQQVHVGVWLPICGWYDHDTAQFFAEHVGDGVTRIVRRYVTEPEEA